MVVLCTDMGSDSLDAIRAVLDMGLDIVEGMCHLDAIRMVVLCTDMGSDSLDAIRAVLDMGLDILEGMCHLDAIRMVVLCTDMGSDTLDAIRGCWTWGWISWRVCAIWMPYAWCSCVRTWGR